MKQKSAYFLSHNGLGDNITNIGAVNFLLNYYETIYFLCKDIYNENVKLLFYNKPVITVPFDSKNEFSACKNVINNNSINSDVFISGFAHKYRIKLKITHPELLQYKKNDYNYTIPYKHILDFYYDIGLDLSIYYNYFDIESSEISKEYYEKIKNYKIVFLHSKSSNREINFTDIVNKYNNNDYIIICANKNVYNINSIKYNIANMYVNIYVAYYIDIIKNAESIHVIDSCFSCIVYPLIITNKITPKEYKIYNR